MESEKLPKVEDSRKRSIMKALTANLLEVIFDTIVMGIIFSFLGLPTEEAFLSGGGLAVLTQVICFFTQYVADRIWNKTQWGRKIVE